MVVFQLLHELDQLKEMNFGAKQERFFPDGVPDPDQLTMGLSTIEGKQGCRGIGRGITEELEYRPGKLYVNQFIRPK